MFGTDYVDLHIHSKTAVDTQSGRSNTIRATLINTRQTNEKASKRTNKQINKQTKTQRALNLSVLSFIYPPMHSFVDSLLSFFFISRLKNKNLT
jgi:hypothetical protein